MDKYFPSKYTTPQDLAASGEVILDGISLKKVSVAERVACGLRMLPEMC